MPSCPPCPDRHHAAKAEGGAGVIHADAKLTAREADRGLPTATSRSSRSRPRRPSALFLAGTYGGASVRLEGLTWGAEDLSAELGAETNRDPAGPFLDPYRLGARALPRRRGRRRGVQAIDTIAADFRNLELLRRETEESAP